MKRSGSCPKKVTIFITIDTEDGYFDVPHLITGEGIPSEPVISKIIEILDQHGFKGNFFLNAYESIRYDADVLPNIVKLIHQKGHAVELHSHADKNLSFYEYNRSPGNIRTVY